MEKRRSLHLGIHKSKRLCHCAGTSRRKVKPEQKMKQISPAIWVAVYFAVCVALGAYFTFAAVQGDYGLFERVRTEADARILHAELADMKDRVAALENKTRRLSDDFLDLDLLDEQARQILGLIRHDEIVIR